MERETEGLGDEAAERLCAPRPSDIQILTKGRSDWNEGNL